MLPFGAQVTGKRDSLLADHILKDKDTLISDFPLLVVRVHPAARQTLAGKKHHVGFAEAGRVRHLFACVEPALDFIPERITEGVDIHHFHNVTAQNVPEKHGSSFTLPKPPASGVFRAPGRGETILAPLATGLIAHTCRGRRETVEIAFLALDCPDQFDFLGLARLHSLVTGNFAYSLDFHDLVSLLEIPQKFQSCACRMAKAWRGRNDATLTDINKSQLFR
ncbi:MAG: hypothetical protein HZA69_05060 [Gammaproteobacteria bacterium]|nr:hypothetical protein [Gammaproteobacteria bacterium]